MRQSVLMIMAAGAVTAFASFPARAQYALCLPARGCIPTTQASYNACLTLARQRGWTDSDNAPRGGIPRALDSFIYQCLQAEYRDRVGCRFVGARRTHQRCRRVTVADSGLYS
jgi:hypothetical protein